MKFQARLVARLGLIKGERIEVKALTDYAVACAAVGDRSPGIGRSLSVGAESASCGEKPARGRSGIQYRSTRRVGRQFRSLMGHNSRDGSWETRIAELTLSTGSSPYNGGSMLRWRGNSEARNAIYYNLLPDVAKAAFTLPAEIVERVFALTFIGSTMHEYDAPSRRSPFVLLTEKTVKI